MGGKGTEHAKTGAGPQGAGLFAGRRSERFSADINKYLAIKIKLDMCVNVTY